MLRSFGLKLLTCLPSGSPLTDCCRGYLERVRSPAIVVDVALSGAQAQDTDEDGVLDVVDNCTDTFNPDQGDFNGNGLGDDCEDSDQDGVWDADELLLGPIRRSRTPTAMG